MSEKNEGPGWWIASDGNWYPPELHPSAVATSMHEVRQPQQVEDAGRVGPQFPDLFQKALEGSHLVDNVTVRNDLGDSGLPSSFMSVPAGRGRGHGSRAPVGAGTGGGGKWRRRKDR